MKTALAYLLSGLLIYFTSYFALFVPTPIPMQAGIYMGLTSICGIILADIGLKFW